MLGQNFIPDFFLSQDNSVKSRYVGPLICHRQVPMLDSSYDKCYVHIPIEIEIMNYENVCFAGRRGTAV